MLGKLILGSHGKYSLQDRCLNASIFAVMITACLLFIGNTMQPFDHKNLILTGSLIVIYGILYYLSRGRHISKYVVWPFIFLCLTSSLYVWFFFDGISGPGYFILLPLFFIIPIVTQSVGRILALLVLIVFATLLFIIEIKYPGQIINYDNLRTELIDIYITFLCIGLGSIFIISLVLYAYKNNEKRLEQLNSDLQITSELIRAKEELLSKQNKTLAKKNVQLLKKERELKEANISKDKFFSIIAHDLKNPLNAILGLSDILVSDFNRLDSSLQIKYNQLINHGGKELYKLLENLLQWSRAQTGRMAFHPKKFHFIDAALPVIDLIKPEAEKKGVSIENTIDRYLPVYADFAMITTVIRNFLNNALKFSTENGIISIKTEDLGADVRISIRDDGIGISKNDQEKLFKIDENFSRVGTSGEKGTGLGLIICKNFVLKNKGKVGVQSNEVQGVTFWFTLPKDIPPE